MRSDRFAIDPTKGSIVKNMFLFSLPIIAVSVLQSVFSAADTAVISRFGEEDAVSAVGTTLPLINLFISSFLGLGTGISVCCGKAFGGRDSASIRRVVNALPLSSLVLGAILAAAMYVLARPVLLLSNCPESLLPGAMTYLRIYFMGSPFMLLFSFLTVMMQTRGNSAAPLLFETFAAVLNLGLNLLFVIVFHLNIVGVAVATVISSAAGTLLLTIWFLRRNDELKLIPSRFTLFADLKDVFLAGAPSAFGGILMNLSAALIQAVLNTFDTAVIAGNTISTSLEGVMTLAFLGFMQASVVFTAQNYGSGDLERVRKVFLTTLFLSVAIGEAVGISVYLLRRPILGIFTNNEEYLEYAMVRLTYIALPYGLLGLMNTLSGCMRGLGSTVLPTVIEFCGSAVFRICWIYLIAVPRHSLTLTYAAYPLCWALTSAAYIVGFFLVYRRAAQKE